MARRPRARGRPARVSREQILDAAGQLGVEALSMRGLAEHLGIGVSTLYYHVASKQELMALLADRLVAGLELPLDDPDRWQAAMHRSAWALRHVFERSPGLASKAMADPDWGDAIAALHEHSCAFLVRAGFTPAEAWLSVRAIADFVEGFVARRQMQSEAGTSDLEGAARTPRHRTLRAAQEELGPREQERRFSYGLDSVVRGLAARRAAKGS